MVPCGVRLGPRGKGFMRKNLTKRRKRYYPGCLDKVVAVGSMAPDGSVAYYSNRGK